MGCWDIYCFICGNTCHSILDDKEYIEKIGFSVKFIKKFNDTINYLNNCTFLTANNEIIHDCTNVSCNIDFKNKKKECLTSSTKFLFSYFDVSTKNYGVFLHTDCWKFIKKTYGIILTYSKLPIVLNMDLVTPIKIDYGKIQKYWRQDQDFYSMIKDGNEWMLSSPLKLNNKNIKRIKKIIKQIKLRKDRISPLVSATFYKAGTIKLGNNNKFWIQSNNKWIELKDEVIIIKKSYRIKSRHYSKFEKNKLFDEIDKIPQIGEYNSTPLFIKSFVRNLKSVDIEYITTREVEKKLIKSKITW